VQGNRRAIDTTDASTDAQLRRRPSRGGADANMVVAANAIAPGGSTLRLKQTAQWVNEVTRRNRAGSAPQPPVSFIGQSFEALQRQLTEQTQPPHHDSADDGDKLNRRHRPAELREEARVGSGRVLPAVDSGDAGDDDAVSWGDGESQHMTSAAAWYESRITERPSQTYAAQQRGPPNVNQPLWPVAAQGQSLAAAATMPISSGGKPSMKNLFLNTLQKTLRKHRSAASFDSAGRTTPASAPLPEPRLPGTPPPPPPTDLNEHRGQLDSLRQHQYPQEQPRQQLHHQWHGASASKPLYPAILDVTTHGGGGSSGATMTLGRERTGRYRRDHYAAVVDVESAPLPESALPTIPGTRHGSRSRSRGRPRPLSPPPPPPSPRHEPYHAAASAPLPEPPLLAMSTWPGVRRVSSRSRSRGRAARPLSPPSSPPPPPTMPLGSSHPPVVVAPRGRARRPLSPHTAAAAALDAVQAPSYGKPRALRRAGSAVVGDGDDDDRNERKWSGTAATAADKDESDAGFDEPAGPVARPPLSPDAATASKSVVSRHRPRLRTHGGPPAVQTRTAGNRNAVTAEAPSGAVPDGGGVARRTSHTLGSAASRRELDAHFVQVQALLSGGGLDEVVAVRVSRATPFAGLARRLEDKAAIVAAELGLPFGGAANAAAAAGDGEWRRPVVAALEYVDSDGCRVVVKDDEDWAACLADVGAKLAVRCILE
ncbi:hypothetical protein HK405_003901, partial [Cladochytrium tenue]